mgnify:CR=1 FL=1
MAIANSDGSIILSTKVDESGLKAWLKDNPVKVIYPLNQPVLELLTMKSVLTLYDTSTTITSNSIIPCKMTIKNKGWSTVLAPSTTYRIVRTGGTPTKYYLGGATSTSNVITTPATLVDSDLRIYGSGSTKNVMVIKNAQPTLNPPFHEGILSTFEDDYNSTTNKYEYKISVTGTDGETNSKIISLNEPLRYLSSTVHDRIIVKDGELVVERKVGQILISGASSNNSTWGLQEGKNGNPPFVWFHIKSLVPILSDKLPNNGVDAYNNFKGTDGTTGANLIRVRITDNDTVESVQKWFEDNPTTFIYQKDVVTYESLGLTRLSMVAYENGTMDVVTNLQPTSITTERTLDISKLTDVQVLNLEERLSNIEATQDITMLAMDEMYTMLEPVLAMTPSTMSLRGTLMQEEVRVPMVELYVVMVQRGLKTIDQVPARYREQVREILGAVEE